MTGPQDENTQENITKNSKNYEKPWKIYGKITFILKILATRMKTDYQDDSSFSSWYPIKPAFCIESYVQVESPKILYLENYRKPNLLKVMCIMCLFVLSSIRPVVKAKEDVLWARVLFLLTWGCTDLIDQCTRELDEYVLSSPQRS